MNDYTEMLQQTLAEYCRTRGITDMSRESMSRWNSYLNYAHNQLFRNRREFLSKPYSTGNLLHGNASNCNSYNLDMINELCNSYIYISYENCKMISVSGFCRLSGISRECMHAWGRYQNHNNMFSISSSDIYKKIKCESEESLCNRLLDNGNPTAILAILNYRYGWKKPRPEPTRTDTPQSVSEIAARYGIAPDDG